MRATYDDYGWSHMYMRSRHDIVVPGGRKVLYGEYTVSFREREEGDEGEGFRCKFEWSYRTIE